MEKTCPKCFSNLHFGKCSNCGYGGYAEFIEDIKSFLFVFSIIVGVGIFVFLPDKIDEEKTIADTSVNTQANKNINNTNKSGFWDDDVLPDLTNYHKDLQNNKQTQVHSTSSWLDSAIPYPPSSNYSDVNSMRERIEELEGENEELKERLDNHSDILDDIEFRSIMNFME